MIVFTFDGSSPTVVRPRSMVCSASSSLFIASNRMMPSEVVRAQALTHLPPTKNKLSNALPGGGAGSAISFSRSGVGALKVGSADLPSTSSASRSVPAACLATARWRSTSGVIASAKARGAANAKQQAQPILSNARRLVRDAEATSSARNEVVIDRSAKRMVASTLVQAVSIAAFILVWRKYAIKVR